MKQVIDQLIVEAAILEMVNEETAAAKKAKKLGLQWKGQAWTKDGKPVAKNSEDKKDLVWIDKDAQKDAEGDKKDSAGVDPRDGQDADNSDVSGKDSVVSSDPVGSTNNDSIRERAFLEKGHVGSFGAEGTTGDPSDENWPNDAIAKQTSWETGHRKGTPAFIATSPTTGRSIEAAPGDAGSLFNELGSNEIADMLQKIAPDGDDLSDEDLAQILHDQFGETHAAKQNGSGSKDKKKQNTYKKKLLDAVQSGRRKNDRMKKALENGSESGFDTENIENAETLYGAADSLQSARNIVRNVPDGAQFFGQEGPITEVPSDERTREEFKESIGASLLASARKLTGNKVTSQTPTEGSDNVALQELWEAGQLPFPPDLIKLTGGDKGKIEGIDEEKMEEYINDLFPEDDEARRDPEKIKNFMEALVLSAGGGNNPADTTTVIKDKNGNLIILQHSDKANLKAQLANSTPNKEYDRATEELERMATDGSIDEETADKAININVEAQEEIKKIEQGLSEVKRAALGRLAEFADDENNAAMIMKLVNESEGDDDTLKRKLHVLIKGMEGETDVEKFQNFTKMLADPEHNVSGDQNRIIEKIRDQMGKHPEVVTEDGEPWGASQLDSSQEQAEIRKAAVSVLQNRVAELNELEDSEGRPIGDVLETRKLIDLLHLYQLDEPSRGVYVQGITETVAGADGVTKENLRRCLGVESSEELVGKIKVGPPVTPEGSDIIDKELGVAEANLTRDPSSPEVDEEGNTLYWIYNKEGKKVGKTSSEEEAKASGKRKDAMPVGTITSQKAVVYYEDESGKRFEIASMSVRAKGGPQAPLGTGYAWSPDMEKCLGKKDEETNESISYGYVQTMILMEMASKV